MSQQTAKPGVLHNLLHRSYNLLWKIARLICEGFAPKENLMKRLLNAMLVAAVIVGTFLAVGQVRAAADAVPPSATRPCVRQISLG